MFFRDWELPLCDKSWDQQVSEPVGWGAEVDSHAGQGTEGCHPVGGYLVTKQLKVTSELKGKLALLSSPLPPPSAYSLFLPFAFSSESSSSKAKAVSV